MNTDSPKKHSFYQRGASLVVNKQVIPLNKKTTTLGRQLENDIVFHEALLSRNHAEIVLEGNQYVLYDKGSTGGTYVNGRKIDHCLLNSGDLISLANIQIMFINNNSTLVGSSLGVTHGLGNLHDEQ